MSDKNVKWSVPVGASRLRDNIRTEFNIGPLVERVLVSRGITEREDVALALGIGLPAYDPFLMKDMDRAVARIRREIEAGGSITVFGDYDVDGLTSAYILSDWLESHGVTCSVYIPEREGEGYGMNRDALERIAAGGTKLIVSVDNGINAVEEAKAALELGMEMVVTDHHTPGEVLPDCCAVVDPHRADCPYPNKHLAGVGVAFKLLCALENGDEASLMSRYGDMLALGTIADVCEVTGENRRLLTAAEPVLKATKNYGLRALGAKCSCPEPGLGDIGFRLAPRLNAAGRMGSAADALKLLKSPDPAQAEANAELLCHANSRRQSVETKILSEAADMAAEESVDINRGLVLYSENWKLGVLGIVSAKLAEKHGVPVIMLANENGMLKGSARSGGDYDIFSAMSRAAEGIAHCGGHRAAAGIKLAPENFSEFKKRFYAITSSEIPFGGLCACIEADAEVEPSDINFRSVTELERLAPFGQGNRQPVFCIRDAKISSLASMGEGKHSRLTLDKGAGRLSAVWFGSSAEKLGFRENDFADIIFTADINEFRGVKNVRLTLKDMAFSFDRAAEEYCRLLSGEGSCRCAPCREVCGVIWNAVKSAPDGVTPQALMRRVCAVRPVGYLELLAALEAFREAGLITGTRIDPKTSDEVITLVPAPPTGQKAALWDTEIFRAFGKEQAI